MAPRTNPDTNTFPDVDSKIQLTKHWFTGSFTVYHAYSPSWIVQFKQARNHFYQGSRSKSSLSCNMMRWFSPQPLKSCWLLTQYKTNSKEIINNCQLYFGLQPLSDAIKKRKINFLNKISTTCNALCKLFVSTASSEMITLCSAA